MKMNLKIVAKMEFEIFHHKTGRKSRVTITQEIPDYTDPVTENVRRQMEAMYHALYVGHIGTFDSKRFFTVEILEIKDY